MQSLRQTEAQARANLLQVTDMDVHLDVRAAHQFTSVATIKFTVNDIWGTTFVDFKGTSLTRATLNGRDLDISTWADGRLPLEGFQPENTLIIDGVMAYSHNAEGLHRHTDPADGKVYLYGMSFLDAAPTWFGCFDQPDLKAPYHFTVDAPETWTVFGNGPANAVPHPEDAQAKRWEIHCAKPLATYFTTICAGPWYSYTQEYAGRTLGIHAKQSLAHLLERDKDDIFAVTTKAFDGFSQIFDAPYGFEDYHQVFVPDFNAGAMENPGCVTLRETLLFPGTPIATDLNSRASTICHEMAHQWFGDMVSMRWWDDLWLNESFAEYLGHRVAEDVYPQSLWTSFGISRKMWGIRADMSPTTHSVAGNGSPDAQTALSSFDGISYAKGAAILRQLVKYLGDEAFLQGVNLYLEQYAWGNATAADLLSCWQKASGKDLSHWAKTWLQTSGVDRLQVKGNMLRVIGPDGAASPRMHAITVASYKPDGTLIGAQNLEVQGFVEVGEGWILPDANDDSWAVVQPDLQQIPVISKLATAARITVFNALRNAVQMTEMSPAQALEIICQALLEESEIDIISAMLQALQKEIVPFMSPDNRKDALAQIFQTAEDICHKAPVDSDIRQVAFRHMVKTCADISPLTAWMTSQNLPEGVILDEDLRWKMTARLVAITKDSSWIGTQMSQSMDAASQIAAVAAKAANPKEKTWALAALAKPEEYSSHQLFAIAENLFMPNQHYHVASLALLWVQQLSKLAQIHTGWVLPHIIQKSVPVGVSDSTVIAVAEKLIESEVLPAHVQHSLIDGLDQMRRSWTAQQKFG